MANIFVPIDFSPCSQKALAYAFLVAKHTNADVTVYHSYHFDSNEYSPFVAYPFVAHEETKNIEAKIEDLMATVLGSYYDVKYTDGSGYVKIDSIIRQGFLVDDLAGLMQQNNYSMVVMGTKGATGAEEIIFGSNAAAAIAAVNCPLLIVPLNATVGDFKNLLYATDFEGNETKVLDELLDFAGYFDATIQCLHITKPDRLIEAEAEAQLLQESYWFAPISKIEVRVRQNESVEKGIDEFMSKNFIDLVIILRRNRSFLEKLFRRSMSKKLAFHSNTPLLILKEK